jgi:hypothetical protein
VYAKEEKENLVKSTFDKLESLFESNSENKLRFSKILNRHKSLKLSDSDIIQFYHHIKIMEISSYLKDESFIDEEEYRIVVEKEKSDETMYRQGNSMIIPYIEVNFSDDDGKLPISKIIVGPTPHPELSKMSVSSLLKSKGYDIEVEISKIPYRSW